MNPTNNTAAPKSPLAGFILGLAVSIIAFFGGLGLIDSDDVERARQLQSEFLSAQKEDAGKILGVLNDIRQTETGVTQNDIGRMEALFFADKAYYLAFIDAAMDILPEEQFDRVYEQALNDVEKVKQELLEMAAPVRRDDAP